MLRAAAAAESDPTTERVERERAVHEIGLNTKLVCVAFEKAGKYEKLFQRRNPFERKKMLTLGGIHRGLKKMEMDWDTSEAA